LKTKSRDEKENKLLKSALQQTGRIDNILSALLSFFWLFLLFSMSYKTFLFFNWTAVITDKKSDDLHFSKDAANQK